MAITKATASSIAPAAKGDLVVGSATNDAGVLAVGTDTHILVADSAESLGMKWAAPAGGGFVGAKVFNSANFNLPNNVYTLLTFNSESFDTDAFHSTSTNTSRLTIPAGKAGKYRVLYTGVVSAMAASTKLVPRIYKNGAGDSLTVTQGSYADDTMAFISAIYDLSATDYLEIYIYQNQGTTQVVLGGLTYNWFELQYLGA
jgi:hypothetical protein